MKTATKGKRGRPKKQPIKIKETPVKEVKPISKLEVKPVLKSIKEIKQEVKLEIKPDEIKKKRGRPSKPKVIGEENIEIKDQLLIKKKRGRPSKPGNSIIEKNDGGQSRFIEEEIYIQPKILRKKRVFRFDKSVFHTFSKKYEGDIVIMSYVFDKLMRMYIDKKIKIPKIDEIYYAEWCKGNPLLEPIEEREISATQAFIRGVPLQYKYPLLIDEEVFSKFEYISKRYPQYISNALVKMLLDDNINISTSKYKEWCIL